MRDINEIWKELENHPDFVTGRVHTKQSVASCLEDFFDEEDFNRISELFVQENKSKIIEAIDEFELGGYRYCTWIDDNTTWIGKKINDIFAYDSEIN